MRVSIGRGGTGDALEAKEKTGITKEEEEQIKRIQWEVVRPWGQQENKASVDGFQIG